MAGEKNASLGQNHGSNGKIPTSLASKFMTNKSNFNVSNILIYFL